MCQVAFTPSASQHPATRPLCRYESPFTRHPHHAPALLLSPRPQGPQPLMLPKENYRVKTMSFGFFLEVRQGMGLVDCWHDWTVKKIGKKYLS